MKRGLRIPALPQQTGLIVIILLLGIVLTHFARTVHGVNIFLNPNNIVQIVTVGAFFAIMAVGVTMVIITGGIDLSVGGTYALSGVVMAMLLQHSPALTATATVNGEPVVNWPAVLAAMGICLGVGLVCGLINGIAVVGLRVHPFIITLGTMWIFRGIAFVSSKAISIPVPDGVTAFTKNTLGLGLQSSPVYPVPMLIMLIVTVVGEIYLLKTVMGRSIYAVGGNSDAARYCGLSIRRSLIGVYVVAGLTAGIAGFVGSSYYGSAACRDADGYELFVVASAVVGGASLIGGRGSAVGAMLGAMLIVLIRRSITTLGFDPNYEWIIVGFAIVVAVVLDRVGADYSARRMARAASARTEIDVETPIVNNKEAIS